MPYGKISESKKLEAKPLWWPPEVIFWRLLDYIAESKEIDISAPQNLISTNGLPMRTCEKALESKKVEAKDLIWPPEVIFGPFWTMLLKQRMLISAHLKILFKPMDYL